METQTITIHATGETIKVQVVDAGMSTTHNGDGKYRRQYAKDASGNYYRYTSRQRWSLCTSTLIRQRAERAFARVEGGVA